MIRKIIFSIAALLLPLQVLAAPTASAIMEMRSTGASNLNSGIFDAGVASPGTDYTLQDTSQFNGTDLASTNGTTNPCVVTSASHNFVAADNGNSLIISAGTSWTVSPAIIVSTSGNAATLDRACGGAATLSGGTWREGGAYPGGNATSGITDDARFEYLSPGNKIYVKTGTYNLNTVAVSPAGTISQPVQVFGYNSTRGDTPTYSQLPVFAMAANSFTSSGFWQFQFIAMTGTPSILFTQPATGIFKDGKLINQSSTTTRVACSSNAGMIERSEIVSYRGYGISSANAATYKNNYIHDSDVGVRRTNSDTTIVDILENIFEGNVTTAIQFTAAATGRATMSHNTIYGAANKLGIGIDILTSTKPYIDHNIITGFVTGVTASAATVSVNEFNDYYNNTTDVTNWTKGYGDVAVNPSFTNVTQVTGTAGAFVAGNNKLVDTTKNFTNLGVVAGDSVLITAGTGFSSPAYPYYITSISTTTNPNDTLNITIPAGPGTDTTTDKVYQITVGHNYIPTGTIPGSPGIFLGNSTTGYMTIGAVQKQSGTSGVVKRVGPGGRIN